MPSKTSARKLSVECPLLAQSVHRTISLSCRRARERRERLAEAMGLTLSQPRWPSPRVEQISRSFAGGLRFPLVSFVCSFSSPLRVLRLWQTVSVDVERSRCRSVKRLHTGAQISFSACCRAAERRIIHGNVSVSGASVGRIIHGNRCRKPQTAYDEKPTQHGRDGLFPLVWIFGCPPMIDTVVAGAVFQNHFPSMLATECDGEGRLKR